MDENCEPGRSGVARYVCIMVLATISVGVYAGCDIFETKESNADFDRVVREGCEVDSDCRRSKFEYGDCCYSECGVDESYNEDFHAKMQDWRDENCDDAQCPSLRCSKPTYRLEAVCSDGFCKLEKAGKIDSR